MAVWLVHKTTGVTSFEALQAARPQGKACHGGSLDPFATGLLPVLVGPAVHVFHALHELPKTYLATLAWGSETDNLDLLGKVIATGDASAIPQVPPPIATGWHDQVPPAFSNKRVKGERAWKLAREGKTVELPAERVYLHEARWLGPDRGATEGSGATFGAPRSGGIDRLRLMVRGGFYVRALARDLGRTLGCRAHLKALHREQIGPWRCPPEGTTTRLSLDDALDWLPVRELTDAEVGALRKKQPIGPGTLRAAKWGLPPGFPELSFAKGLHLGRTVALFRGEKLFAWL